MSDPFDHLSFEEEIKPEHWTEETRLHTPTFEALLQEDETLYLSGPALQEGFSVSDVQALTRFLSERVQLPPLESPYDFADFTPTPVILVEPTHKCLAESCAARVPTSSRLGFCSEHYSLIGTDQAILEIWQTGPDAPHSLSTTWQVLDSYQDVDLEMWVCRIIAPEKPAGEISACYAWAIMDMAERLGDMKGSED